jgi:hypothetical protein
MGIWATLGAFDEDLAVLQLRRKIVVNPIKLWMGLDPACDWRKSAYAALPERLKPSPLNLIFKDLTNRGRTIDPATALFRLADFDAY